MAMDSAGITRLELLRRGKPVYYLALPLSPHLDYCLVIFYTDTLVSDCL
ncbi:hypothetical protein [Sodalis-like endosymbiont of Proechinophthirus fluctus]|nr:hypothetical protein [Sodalis-like endosymbiont of Proechinophthirus fluctus]